jgi:hypothetical protein
MPPDMDKSHDIPKTSPGYETRDANTGGVLNFLVILGAVLAATALISWGMFRYLAVHDQQDAAASPFADTRPLPLGPQLQVTPREDWLKYREDQERNLENYSWVNRDTGIVSVPIEQAMEILLKKGLPVQGQTPPASIEKPAESAAKGGKKP